MSENVALSKKKQKTFNKTVKKTKDKIKKGDIKITDKVPRKKLDRGIVYLSNIPHGFYEKELKGYFGQFGQVLKARVARSKRTGNSKGHAFIMFKQPEVAKIAADTMDNYLMGKRLLKAKLLPFDKKAKGIFKKPNFSKEHYPTMVRRTRFKKSFNAAITEEKQEQKNKSALKHIKNVVDKLKAIGIDYDFKPANPPKKQIIKKEEKENMDDSSSEDIVFTSPEEMDRKTTEAEVELKKSKKQNEENGINPLKKIKKSANSSNNINLEKSAKKKNKTEENITEERRVTRKKKSKENQIEKVVNETSSANLREKKQKKRIVKNEDQLKIQLKNLKKKQVSFENTVETISSDVKNEKPKNKKKSKVLVIPNIPESISPSIIKKKSKRNQEESNKSLNKKTVGVTKKPKKTEKISDKKASLIKELIKDNTQIKTVKKIKKDATTKKNKLKVKKETKN